MCFLKKVIQFLHINFNKSMNKKQKIIILVVVLVTVVLFLLYVFNVKKEKNIINIKSDVELQDKEILKKLIPDEIIKETEEEREERVEEQKDVLKQLSPVQEKTKTDLNNLNPDESQKNSDILNKLRQ